MKPIKIAAVSAALLMLIACSPHDAPAPGPRSNGSHVITLGGPSTSAGLPFPDMSSTPLTPASGVTLYSSAIASRSTLSMLRSDGVSSPVQSGFGFRTIGIIAGESPTAAFSTTGSMVAASVTGTLTARAPTTTNLMTSLSRTGIVSAATAGSVTSVSSASKVWRGNASGLGGFFIVMRFAISDASLVTTANMFAGIIAGGSFLNTDVAPSTKTFILGIGCDNGDTHLQLYAAGTAAQARTDLGASFPVNTTNTDTYELVLYAAPNSTVVNYRVRRLSTGDTATGSISATAQLFDTSTFMEPEIFRSNGGTASAVGIDVSQIYMESG